MKKIIIIILSLLAIVFGGSYIALKFLLKKQVKSDFILAKSIPATSVLSIKVDNLLQLQEFYQSDWSPLLSKELFQALPQTIELISDIFSDKFFDDYQNQAWVFSLHSSGGSASEIAIFTMMQENNEIDLYTVHNAYTVEDKKYDGVKFKRVKNNTNTIQKSICFWEENNVLSFTTGTLLMEEVIRTKHAKDLSSNLAEETFTDSGLKLVINWNNLEKSFFPIFFKNNFTQQWLFKDFLKNVKTSLESSSKISFTGTYDSELSILALSDNTANSDWKFAEIVPANAYWVMNIPVNKTIDYMSVFRILQSRKDSKNVPISIPEIQSEAFYKDVLAKAESISIIKFIDIEGAASEVIALKRKAESGDSLLVKKMSGVNTSDYFPSNQGEVLNCILTLKDWTILGYDVKHLEYVKLNVEAGKTLDKRKDFKDLKAFYKEKFSFKLYLNIMESGDAFSDVLVSSEYEKFKINKENLQDVGIWGLGVKAQNGNAIMNVSFFPYLESAGQTRVVSSAKFNSNLSAGPFSFINHNTNKKEWIVQDEQKYLYLLDESLNILWSKPLSESIISQVYLIDKFKNGRFQMLFSDNKSIRILDRNGDLVVETSNLSTPYLSVFDYDKNKSYRIIGQTSSKLISNWDVDFKPVSGWQLKKLGAELNVQPVHLKVGDKDLILFSNPDSLIFVNRRGERQKDFCRVSEFNPRLKMQTIVGKNFDESFIIGVANDGRILIESFTGVKKYLSISDKITSFFAKNIDGKITIAMAGGSTVRLMNIDGETIYKTELSNSQEIKEIYFIKGNEKYLIVVNQMGNLLMLNSDDTVIDNAELGSIDRMIRIKNEENKLFVSSGNSLKLIALEVE